MKKKKNKIKATGFLIDLGFWAKEMVQDFETALWLAYRRGHKTIYDLENDKYIDVPTPQSGTDAQNYSYIKSKIRKMVEERKNTYTKL